RTASTTQSINIVNVGPAFTSTDPGQVECIADIKAAVEEEEATCQNAGVARSCGLTFDVVGTFTMPDSCATSVIVTYTVTDQCDRIGRTSSRKRDYTCGPALPAKQAGQVYANLCTLASVAVPARSIR